MKVLYIAPGDHMDYQNDALLIGLKEVLGADVVDANKHHHLYDSFPAEAAAGMYGKGMTVTRVLPDLDVDRTDMEARIRARAFDAVVYGSIWRCADYFDLVRATYPGDRIALVDGEDAPTLHPFIGYPLHYFKRELLAWWRSPQQPDVHPISFAFPTSKVNFSEPKTRDIAHCDPRDTSTYIYGDEASYYRGYGESRFAVTIKKAGWDCMRHYEIVGNGCIPLFLDVAACPEQTMTSFPKDACARILETNIDADVYDAHAEWFREYTAKHLTTRVLAERFLHTMSAGASVRVASPERLAA